MRRGAQFLALACAVVLPFFPAPVQAEVYYGCLKCVYVEVGMFGSGSECQQVGDNEEGDGTRCRQEVIFGGPACLLSGNPCYNVVVTGGGGESPTGGSTCAYEDNGYCAPWCAACSQV